MTQSYENTSSTGGPEAIFAVLEGKSWYQQRFAKQVKSLFPNAGSALRDDQIIILYISKQLRKIPPAERADVCTFTAKLLVDKSNECPYPSQLLCVIAEAALKYHSLTFEQLYERAKEFFALPPSSAEVANRWVERVIYSTVKRLGRERFVMVTSDEWRQAVTDTLVADDVELEAFVPAPKQQSIAVHHDFRSLLKDKQ